MIVLYDNMRHLITVPYTDDNMHLAAQLIGIKRAWFHPSRKRSRSHYDIPKRLFKKLPTLLHMPFVAGLSIMKVTPRELLAQIRRVRP